MLPGKSSLPSLIEEAARLGSGHPPGVCPCCGQAAPADDFYVSLDTNRASRFGQEVRLGPQDAEILSILVEDWPGTVRAGKIMSGLYGRGDWPENPRNVLRVKISRIRRMVAALGVGIHGHYDSGYRLSVEDKPIKYAREPKVERSALASLKAVLRQRKDFLTQARERLAAAEANYADDSHA